MNKTGPEPCWPGPARRLRPARLAAAVCVTLVWMAGHAAMAQAGKADGLPRTSDGKPDLAGYWTNGSLTRLERPREFANRLVMTAGEVERLEGAHAKVMADGDKPTPVDAPAVLQECDVPAWSTNTRTDCGYNTAWIDPGSTVMRVGGEPRTSFVTSTPDGRLPASRADPALLRRAFTRTVDDPEGRSLDERCIINATAFGPIMLPYYYNNNLQIIQTKNHVVLLAEMNHDVRLIPLDRTAHLPGGVRPYMGDSIGRWDGDTLVVETTNFPAAQASVFRGASTDLRVTERFTRVAADRLLYQFEVSDPRTWNQTWGGEYEFGSTRGPIYEYACHEGNYALLGILAGARRSAGKD